MKNFTILFLFIFPTLIFGQDTWGKISKSTSDDVIVAKMPTSYQLYNNDILAVKETLQDAPMRFETSFKNSKTILRLPNQERELQHFKILEAPMMEPELAAKFPMIKTYVGQGIEDPTAILNLSIGTNGLHAMIRSTGKSPFFIEPYTKDRQKYIGFSKSDQAISTESVCGVIDEAPRPSHQQVTANTENITDGKLRQYNLAVATTIEYSAYHLTNQGVPSGASTAVKKAAVLSAITAIISGIRGVYETEIGATFILNANQDAVIFIDSDNFTNNHQGTLLGESQVEIDNAIGNANYDIGHVFCTTLGGVTSSTGRICTVNSKAKGVSGAGGPIGSYFMGLAMHEMGHQFGAHHSYNGTGSGSCTTSTASTAAETGSGSTIMSYAGICSNLNVQSVWDSYFHIVSIKEINDRFNNTGSYTHPTFLQCSSDINTGNHEPIADAGSDYTIPNGTAFVLSGSATDADGDAMTYCWEQMDLEQPNIYPLASTTTTGPLYRSFPPATSSSRYMPAFETVYNNSLQNTWEVTPTVARNLNFSLTVRDNRAGGGQVTSDDMLVTVAAVGPFAVSSQSTFETWNTGENKTITWNVAGTTANNINVANVEITLVDNTGAVVNTLAASTPNDGSHNITVPNIISNNVQIKVAAIGNIFYALNSGTIGLNTTPAYCNNLCASAGSTQYNDGTMLVNFGSINNASNGAPNYSDYTHISTDVNKGQSYNLTVNSNTSGPYTEQTKVWIDWNRDCDFDDAGEEYDLGTAYNTSNGATSNSPLSIMIPANAELGDTRMRVTSAYISTKPMATSCQSGFWGEVEDYNLRVVSSPLPIELSRFYGKNIGTANQLNWETFSETNNKGFEIQRLVEGNEWKTLGFINGAGNTNEQQFYEFRDESPLDETNYYRLEQFDVDGQTSFSNIISIQNKKTTSEIHFYPNPSSDKITFSKVLKNTNIEVFDAQGKLVLQTQLNDSNSMDINHLEAGVYFMLIYEKEIRTYHKLIKN